ncbi:MAG: hypothetical protein NC293_13335 [Roseburia sp.]|nr:hypothetical protein [Roseburia sp.]
MIWAKEETMSRAEIEAIQLERLQETVKRVYEKVVPYRRKMEAAGVKPEDIKTLEDLQKLPFVTKQDMRDNYPFGLFAVPKEDLVRIHASSGTTGKPTVVGYTKKDLEMWTISTIFAIVVSGGCYFLGGFGRLFDMPGIHNPDGSVVYDAIIPTMLSTLPDILVGIVIVLVLSASMSTLSSLVLTSSSTLTLDFLKDNIIKKMSDKKQLFCMRILLVFFIACSVILALFPPKSIAQFIAQLMGISWGALAGAFLAPFLYGLYWKGVTRAAVWASFICGIGITVSNMFFSYIASPINAGAIAMIAGLVIVPVVSLLTPKMEQKEVDGIFECLEEQVVVDQKTALPKK